jgi:hypothetical protein
VVVAAFVLTWIRLRKARRAIRYCCSSDTWRGVGATTANGNTTDLYYFRLDDDSPATTCEELANL